MGFESATYTEFGYDDRGRITSNVIKNALGVPQRSESVSYNAAGRVTSRTIDGVTTSYTYDAAGNLLAESRTGYSASYTYDTSGRRTSKTVNNATQNYTYSGGRLSQGSAQPRLATMATAGGPQGHRVGHHQLRL